MAQGKQISKRTTGVVYVARAHSKVPGRIKAPPPSARPVSLQTSRAHLLTSLAWLPSISRSIGLLV